MSALTDFPYFRSRTVRSIRVARMILPVLLLSLGIGCSRKDAEQPGQKQQPFKICVGGVLAPLPFIAKKKGYFQAEGVAADLVLIGDGKAAMNEFLEGKCDACLSGEFTVARASFDRNDLAIIATVSSSTNRVRVLALRDRGIATPADLVGKRVGVSKGTIANYFFDQFLKKNNIPREKLTVLDISHQVIADALKRGEIDAYAGSDIAYLKGKELIGDRGITFAEPGLTNHAVCLTVGKKWLAAHGDIARNALKALIRAEKELAEHPAEQITLLSQGLNLRESELADIVAEQENRVSLGHVLILALEDEARWMLETGMLTGKSPPNYLHVIDPAALAAVDPAAVTLK